MADDSDARNDGSPGAADPAGPLPAGAGFTQPYPGAPPQPVGGSNRPPGPGAPPPAPSPSGAPGVYGPAHPGSGFAGAPYAAAPGGQHPAAPGGGRYPGAPGGAYGGGAPPRDPRPRGLAIAALSVAIGGVLVSWIPLVGVLALLTALVLGIIVLVRKDQGGKGLGVAAVIISAVSALIVIVISLVSIGLWATAWQRDSQPYSDWSAPYTSEPVPPVDDGPGPPIPADPVDVTGVDLGTAAAPYAYGDTATIGDGATGTPVWDIAVGAPLDRTAELVDAEELYNPLPENGVYAAFEVTLTYLGEGSIDPYMDYEWAPALTWTDAQGVEHAEAYVWFDSGDVVTLIDVEKLTTGETVTVTYVVDAPADLVGSASIKIGYGPDLQVNWAGPR